MCAVCAFHVPGQPHGMVPPQGKTSETRYRKYPQVIVDRSIQTLIH